VSDLPVHMEAVLLEVQRCLMKAARVVLRRLEFPDGRVTSLLSVTCKLPPEIRYRLNGRRGPQTDTLSVSPAALLDLRLQDDPVVLTVPVTVLLVRDLHASKHSCSGMLWLRTLRLGADPAGESTVVMGGSLELGETGESWHWEGDWSEPAAPYLVSGQGGFLAPTPDRLVRACLRRLEKEFTLDLEIEAVDMVSAAIERRSIPGVPLPVTRDCSLAWAPEALARDVSRALACQPLVRSLVCPVSMMKVSPGDPVDWDENLEPIWDHPSFIDDEIVATVIRVEVRQVSPGRWVLRPRGTIEGRAFRLLSRCF